MRADTITPTNNGWRCTLSDGTLIDAATLKDLRDEFDRRENMPTFTEKIVDITARREGLEAEVDAALRAAGWRQRTVMQGEVLWEWPRPYGPCLPRDEAVKYQLWLDRK